MPNSLREVKVKMEATKNTLQITKAMHMVSKSKVKKANDNYIAYLAFLEKIKTIISHVLGSHNDLLQHPFLLESKQEKKVKAFILITSDKGLVGSYNANIYKKFKELTANLQKDDFYAGSIGILGHSFLKKQDLNLILDHPIIIRDDVMFLDIDPLFKEIADLYLNSRIDEVYVIYNHYVNTLTTEVCVERILPFSLSDIEHNAVSYNFESGVKETLDNLIPLYIENLTFGIILDSKRAEHNARMNAMQSASDNAKDVISRLEIIYNKARQDSITNELTDIISGANAIGG